MYVVIVIIILEFTKIHITQSLVITVIYCYSAYALPSRDTARIHSVKNSALRFVFNLRRFEHVFAYPEACHMLPVETLSRIPTCCMTHKVLTVIEP